MTSTSNDNDRLGQIEETLKTLIQEVRQTNQRLEEETRRWDERFYNQSRDYGQTSRTIIITAGSVVIFSPVLSALAPAIAELARRFFGLTG